MFVVNIISFLLEQLILVAFDKNSIFIPLFSLISLIITYQLLKNKKNLIYVGLVMGLLYDIALTQTLFLNTLLFMLVSLIIIYYYSITSTKLIYTIILTIISIVVYRTITYIVYILFTIEPFNFFELLKGIYSSLIINIIYIVIIQLIFNKKIKRRKKDTEYTY